LVHTDPMEEPRPVDVLHDGRWLRGWLLAARRNARGPWRGLGRTPGAGDAVPPLARRGRAQAGVADGV